MPIFELLVARRGRKARTGPAHVQRRLRRAVCGGSSRRSAASTRTKRASAMSSDGGPARTIAAGVTMQQLAANLSNHLERSVVDKTGLTDRFDFNIGVDAGPAANDGSAAWHSAGRSQQSAAGHSVAGAAWPQSRGCQRAGGCARHRQRAASDAGLRAPTTHAGRSAPAAAVC